MPFLSARLVRLLSGLRRGADLVVPLTEKGHEPLCALYRVSCLPAAERQIAEGDLRVASLFRHVRTREVPESRLRSADPELLSFFNANRPGDLERAAEVLRRLPLSALRRT
jgi:molybdopterin-guanine dinucleotide biosynthesis protein A